jgi:hypothetical protein
MKHTYTSILSRVILSSLVIASPLIATENDQTKTQEKPSTVQKSVAEQEKDAERIPVGTRALSQSEITSVQEKRAEEDYKNLQARSNPSAEESEHVGTPIVVKEEKREGAEKEANEGSPNAEELISKSLFSKGYTYYTSHAGALHQPMAVGAYGETVELEDGSIWSIYSGDRYKTLNWYTSDPIIVLPNHYFSLYNYKIINVNTGAVCQANLFLGPIYNGYYTKWITAIDYIQELVWLNDGTCWQMSGYDYSTVQKWLPNDTVIIGINDGSFSGSNPNILINVNMLNYAIGKCF